MSWVAEVALGFPGHAGVLQAGGIQTVTLAAIASSADAQYVDYSCKLLDGTNRERRIIDYVGATKVATVSPWGPGYLSLPGTSGNYASTPDSAALDITGDIDIRVKALCNDWTPPQLSEFVDKLLVGETQFSYLFRLVTDGKLQLFWTTNGLTLNQRLSTVAVGATDGTLKWVRVTLDVDNGAAGHDVKFYTSDDGVTWAQLGVTITAAGTTSIFAGTAEIQIGGHRSSVAGPWAGKVYYAEVRNGIDGPVVAKFDLFNAANGQVTAFESSTGEVWTINQSGSPVAELTGFPDATTPYELIPPSVFFGEPQLNAGWYKEGALA